MNEVEKRQEYASAFHMHKLLATVNEFFSREEKGSKCEWFSDSKKL